MAKRVEAVIVSDLGSVVMQGLPDQDMFDFLFEPADENASKKRQARELGTN